jgi:predicted dehydrogenase
MNRRHFLKASAASTFALSVAPAFLRAQDPGKKYTLALIGTGWWGTNILREALASGQCKLIALCDVDANQLDKCVAAAAKLTADQPKRYEDYRELLRNEKPEIVINATPDHWHALVTIDAVAGGAHVYVEKPISHTVTEGIAMVKAARAAERVVQVGTHRRVSPHNVSGQEFIRNGKAGKIGMVRCFVNYGGGPEKPEANGEPPKGMNWDLWCGPAPLRPYNKKLHPKGFRQVLDYGNGTLGDWGIHWLDQILWIMDAQAPKRVFSTGGRPIKGPAVNDGKVQTTDAPDHQIAVFNFDGFDVSWEHRQFGGNFNEKTDRKQAVGCYFYGTKGVFHQGWLDGWTFYPVDGGPPIHQDAKLNEPDQQNIKELWADFMDAIRKNRRPVSDIEHGHRSTTCALLGMLSLKLGRSVEWDAQKQTIVKDAEAHRMLSREYRGGWKYPTV